MRMVMMKKTIINEIGAEKWRKMKMEAKNEG